MADAAKNLMETQLDDLPWGEADLAPSLARMYDHVQAKTLETIGWYMNRKRLRAVLSQGLRFSAIVFATVGSVVPLLQAASLLPKSIPDTMGQVGYVGFAIAAGCIALDRFFGVSTAWMRYITSAFALQRALAEFQFDWVILQVKLGGHPPTREQAEQMLLRLREFRSSVLKVVEQETNSWVAEFQSNLGDLYRMTKTRMDALEPGILDITVSNGAQADGELTVLVDGSVRERFRGTRCQIPRVLAGHHTVLVQGTIRGVSVEISGTVQIPPGAVGSMSLALPPPPSTGTAAGVA